MTFGVVQTRKFAKIILQNQYTRTSVMGNANIYFHNFWKSVIFVFCAIKTVKNRYV